MGIDSEWKNKLAPLVDRDQFIQEALLNNKGISLLAYTDEKVRFFEGIPKIFK